jgi:hypothetical protein
LHINWKRRGWTLAILIASLTAIAAAAGIRDSLEKLMSKEIRFEIKVTDEQGRPLDGATIWFFGDSSLRQDFELEDMARLVRRHARDVDFVFENTLHPILLIERTNVSGTAVVIREDAEVGRLDSLRMYFGVLKRGKLAQVFERTAAPREVQKITISLKDDASTASDPRLERLDHQRAIAEQALETDEPLTEQNMKLLNGIEADLRQLAGKLEAEGASDAAAAVYYNLAYLPDVEIVTDQAGGLVRREYSRGFDPRSARRLADREHAWKLAHSRPALEYESAVMRYMGDLIGPATPARVESRQQYIAATEKFFSAYPQQMWPPFHVNFWQTYGALGNADRACDALQAFAEFEPSYYSAAEWRKQLAYYEADVALFHSKPTRKCALPALRQANRVHSP